METANLKWQPPTLETSRLILRPLKLSDAESIFDYAKNPTISKYTLWEAHKTVDESLGYIKDYAFNYYSKGSPEPLGIVLKECPEKVIGTVGCFWVSQNNRCMELAYALSEKHWGQGIMVEAATAMMDYCFKEFKLKRIQAHYKSENTQSGRVMEKIGMLYEGNLKSAKFHRDRFWDMIVYAKVVE